MKKTVYLGILLCLLLLCGAGMSAAINVPDDYSTIQEAIEAAVDGDIILVAPGTYQENINFSGKAITIGSYYVTTQDTSYISQTVIDGGQSGSVVTFNNQENENSVLTGFTISNGNSSNNGGGIFVGDYGRPTLNHLKIINNQAAWYGGGYYFGEYCTSAVSDLLVSGNSSYEGGGGAYSYYCDLLLEDSVIKDNICESAGGGIYSEETDLHLENVVIENNTAYWGGGISLINGNSSLVDVFIYRNQAENGGGICNWGNLYLENVTITENSADWSGGGIYNSYYELIFASDIPHRCSIYLNDQGKSNYGNDIYSNVELDVYLTAFSVYNPTEYYASPLSAFNFDIQFGLRQQVDGDLYISCDGNNENSGISAEEPLQTIRKANSLMLATEDDPHTIHLAEGTYSPSATGERFPVSLLDNVSLCGEDMESVILDAEGNSRVLYLLSLSNATIEGMTLTNGYADHGAGILASFSEVILQDLKIINNISEGYGGGIYLDSSPVVMNRLLIVDNVATNKGGGIVITGDFGGLIKNCTITGNSATIDGGALEVSSEPVIIVNSVLWDNYPQEIHNNSWLGLDLTVAYSDLDGGESAIAAGSGNVNWLAGNLEIDPMFADVENGDYTLQPSSPCFDTGTAYFEFESEILLDLMPEDYWGEAPDMGAYELVITDAEEEDITPVAAALRNYPNPFNPVTTISFNLATAGYTTLDIYNVTGQKVKTLIDNELTAGDYQIIWDGTGRDGQTLSSGMYFYKLSSGNLSATSKMVLMK
ncbi:MAG: DUF1565 domain-containing protein [Candidatus Cloacimonetes bacterium]|nr:DUF1565 domain-containing protein [Candidatus Cloacimonadota bacterium]